MSWIKVAEDNIADHQTHYNQNARNLELFQDVMDYMNDITECLSKAMYFNSYFKDEKMDQIEEAEVTLDKIEMNYSTHYVEKLTNEVKGAVDQNPLENIRSIFSGDIHPIITNQDDETHNNLKYDKAAIYLAAKEIFADVVEEYTNVKIIIDQFFSFKEACEIEDDKITDWLTELLTPFVRIDLIGYDPLGYTDKEHNLHELENFLELPTLSELSSAQGIEQEAGNQLDRGDYLRKLKRDVLDQVLGTVIFLVSKLMF
jgi:hypothetical protein